MFAQSGTREYIVNTEKWNVSKKYDIRDISAFIALRDFARRHTFRTHIIF